MITETITSFTNTTVKLLRRLHDKKSRLSEGLFLAEGMRVVAEAIDAGIYPAILAHGISVRDHPVLQRLAVATQEHGGRVIEISDDVLAKIVRKDNPQMIVAAFEMQSLALGDLDRSAMDIVLVLEGLKDPGNLGTILRTGDAIAASAIILIDQCCDPFSTEAVRASMGALFTQELAQASWVEFEPWLRSAPAQLVGATLNTSHDYQAVNYKTPTFIFMGNEQSGLPPAYEAACDVQVKIPMLGRADSLNVAVSTAVLAYEVVNQRRSKPGIK